MPTTATPGFCNPSAGILVEQSSQKSPTRQAEWKNHLQDTVKIRPQDDSKNRLDIINPVSLLGVIDVDTLKTLLIAKKQRIWSTRVRILGLLLLIDYVCRHLKNGRISISADLAHQYVSKVSRRNSAATITEPLLLLCKVGIL